jgi:hypothetical protein
MTASEIPPPPFEALVANLSATTIEVPPPEHPSQPPEAPPRGVPLQRPFPRTIHASAAQRVGEGTLGSGVSQAEGIVPVRLSLG